MTHALKHYEHNNIICDMRNSRNIFFPLMKDGKKIADVEKNVVADYSFFRLNILNGLDGETYKDMFKIFSQISKDNGFRGLFFRSTNSFPKYRRKLTEYGYFKFADGRENEDAAIESDYLKHVNGKFMLITHNDKKYIIDKKEYQNLIENNIEITVADKYSPFSRMLIGGERVKCDEYDPEKIFLDDLKTLENVTFEYDSICSCLSLFFSLDNMSSKDKVVLPKINITNGEDTFVCIHFVDNKTGKRVPIQKDMFDFKNIKNYDDVKIGEDIMGPALIFNMNSPELKHEKHDNDLSL